MGTLSRAAPATLLLVGMLAGPASAQHYKWDIGGFGGLSVFTKSLSSDETGVSSGTGSSVKFENGTLGGGQITLWPNQRIGVRLDGMFEARPLDGAGTLLYGTTNLYMGTVDVLWRFRGPNAEWSGTEILPYLTGGLGVRYQNPSNAPYTCSPGQVDCSLAVVPPSLVVISTFDEPSKASAAALIGIGTDIRLWPHISLRLEANDRIFKPAFYPAAYPVDLATSTLPQGEDNVAKLTQEFGAQLGVQLNLGLKRAETVATTAPPLPPPPPAQQPQAPPPPPPPPPERDVNVCVIDPATNGGMHMVAARFRPASHDTVVVQGGQPVSLASTVSGVNVVANSDWYLRGQPFAVVAGQHRMEYVTFGSARAMDPSLVVYLGDANGVAVYANRDEASALADGLAQARSSGNANDLAALLRNRNQLRQQFDKLSVLYVPLQPVGCIVQPLQKQEQVRKGE